MFDLEVVRRGLCANMRALADREDCQLVPYALSEPTPPTIQVMGPDEIAYDVAMQRGGDSIMMVVHAFVAYGMDQGAQIKLDRLLSSSGDSSVKGAVESDTTLGGEVDDLRVVSSSGYQMYPRSDNRVVLGAEWTVQIETTA